jgi:hypothetical protein
MPEYKTGAIKRMGSGLMDKLVIEFEEVFWDKDTDWINYVSEVGSEWC